MIKKVVFALLREKRYLAGNFYFAFETKNHYLGISHYVDLDWIRHLQPSVICEAQPRLMGSAAGRRHPATTDALSWTGREAQRQQVVADCHGSHLRFSKVSMFFLAAMVRIESNRMRRAAMVQRNPKRREEKVKRRTI